MTTDCAGCVPCAYSCPEDEQCRVTAPTAGSAESVCCDATVCCDDTACGDEVCCDDAHCDEPPCTDGCDQPDCFDEFWARECAKHCGAHDHAHHGAYGHKHWTDIVSMQPPSMRMPDLAFPCCGHDSYPYSSDVHRGAITISHADSTTAATTPTQTDNFSGTPATNIDEIAFQPPLPFHCHWDSCDLSFLDSLAFDEHLLTDHIKPFDPVVPSCISQPQALAPLQVLPTAQQLPTNAVRPTAIGAASELAELTCEWDHCHKQPASPKALFEHLKQDHVNGTEGRHHRCRWLVADAATGKIRPCGLCLTSAEALTKHLTTDHIPTWQKSYVCYWEGCSREDRKPFVQRQKLLRHLVSHTGDRPFACAFAGCKYRCSDATVLRQHERTHTGERPCICTVCGKGFAASTALSVHMRTHTGYKPLKCKHPGCHRRFAESSNLAKHMRSHERSPDGSDAGKSSPEDGNEGDDKVERAIGATSVGNVARNGDDGTSAENTAATKRRRFDADAAKKDRLRHSPCCSDEECAV